MLRAEHLELQRVYGDCEGAVLARKETTERKAVTLVLLPVLSHVQLEGLVRLVVRPALRQTGLAREREQKQLDGNLDPGEFFVNQTLLGLGDAPLEFLGQAREHPC